MKLGRSGSKAKLTLTLSIILCDDALDTASPPPLPVHPLVERAGVLVLECWKHASGVQ